MKPGENLIYINPTELEVGIKVNHLNIKDVQAYTMVASGMKWKKLSGAKTS